MSKTLTINKRAASGSSKDANSTSRAPVRGRNRNNHVAPSKPPLARADAGSRPTREGGDRRDERRDDRPRAPRSDFGSRPARDDRRDDRPRAPRSDFGARPPRDDRAPRPPRENREGGDRRDDRRDDRPRAPRSDFGARPPRDDRAPRPPRENREGGDRRDDRRDDRPRAPRSDFGARPPRDDRAPRPPRENREGGDRRDDRRDDRPRAPRSDFGARPPRDDRAPRPPRENREGSDRRDDRPRAPRSDFGSRPPRDDRTAKPNHRESLSRAPQRHGKVRDGVREVVDGHVVRGEKSHASKKPYVHKERDHSSEIKTNPADGIRISKYLADKGLCSRREADHYIEKGWVTVNGVRVTLGQRILPTDKVQLARQATVAQESRVTIIINKPMGYVSGQAEDGYEPAVSLVTAENQWDEAEFQQDFNFKHLCGLAPAGRLDIDSVGLLVLTQDGRVAKQLIGEDSEVDKEYLVRVEGELIENGLALLNHGLELDGVPLRPAQVSWQNDEQLMFVLREGKKRQIRRMCELVGLKVVGLKRVRIGNVTLGHLPTGMWRYLAEDEGF